MLVCKIFVSISLKFLLCFKAHHVASRGTYISYMTPFRGAPFALWVQTGAVGSDLDGGGPNVDETYIVNTDQSWKPLSASDKIHSWSGLPVALTL